MFFRVASNRTITRIYFIILLIAFIIISSQFTRKNHLKNSISYECTPLYNSMAKINTKEVYSNFDFNTNWSMNRSFWNEFYEERVKKRENKFPLKVFVLFHSHNDPGWLKTFDEYFNIFTKSILDVIVKKLIDYEDMRFVWTEISFLDLWWQEATAEQRNAFKKLVKEGRLEIMTGGWVMTDEANVHLYAMLDQLIEGHQWVKSKLDVKPKVGWSIDPFGQGSSVPHLLAKSGFDGAIIQRIHYNWKEWLARHQSGDFYWKSHWHTPRSSEYTLLTHNMPFDIYSTHHSCGPNQDKCELLNFCNVPWIWNEAKKENVTELNIEKFANIMIEQYEKTASLFSHNVAFILVGNDFSYWNELEIEQQYENYKMLFDYINSNSNKYNGASLQFGTPSDYFNEIKKRQKENFPSLIGDFFPYSDIFTTGLPAYWTGYFSTRPFYKILSRELEHNLRNAEILFTIAYNKAKQSEQIDDVRIMEKNYEMVIEARRNLGLFQHHDAITGTSTYLVMLNYQNLLQKSLKNVIKLQQKSIEFLHQIKDENFLIYEYENIKTNQITQKKVIKVSKDEFTQVLLFNSLPHDRIEVISLHVTSIYTQVYDFKGNKLNHQINSIIINETTSKDVKELLFVIKLPALSTTLIQLKDGDEIENLSTFQMNSKFIDEISIENSKMKLIFDRNSGFLKSMNDMQLQIEFGSYKSAVRESGAYLFKPEKENENEFENYRDKIIYIQKGPIASDVTIIYGKLLSHTVRIFNTKTYLDDAILINNYVDFGMSYFNRDKEMFMRIKSSIENMKNENVTEFFTDLNGFQFQPRKLVPNLGVEGNYYPISSSVFIQDDSMRMSLITTHAQGATSLKRGEIEVMLDRRMKFDDSRGMNEGILDNVKTQQKFWLTLEHFSKKSNMKESNVYHMPSLFVYHLTNALNYPVNSFIVESKKRKLKISNEMRLMKNLPCDLNLINLRTLTDEKLQWLPSQNALLILHRLGFDCRLSNALFLKQICADEISLDDIQISKCLDIKSIHKTSLTGLYSKRNIKSLSDDSLDSMELATYNITFS